MALTLITVSYTHLDVYKRQVLVIERGDSAGCKNMTGGRLYAHTLEAIIPGFAASAPVERKVTREKISFLTEESAVTLDFHREQPDVPQHASYTVLRNRLDPWLMEQAEQAGAQFIPGVRVDALVREGNKVTGVQAGDDILEANVVIRADGVNSMLGRSLGMVSASDPHHYAVGVKEVIGLTPEQINDRFNVTGEEGAAWLFADVYKRQDLLISVPLRRKSFSAAHSLRAV